jgi:hypothetical protein
MADENERGRQWIVEPPEPGAVSLHVAFGEGVDLTPEQQQALGNLLRTLEAGDADVMGLAKCDGHVTNCTLQCGKVRCGTLECGPLTKGVTSMGTEQWNLMGTYSPSVG